MPAVVIESLVFDEDNERVLARHGISPDQLLEVLEQPPALLRSNRAGSHATHKVIGRDKAGRCLTIAVAPTYRRRIWRPLAAWTCSDQEQEELSEHVE